MTIDFVISFFLLLSMLLLRLRWHICRQERIKASGGEVARLKAANGIEIGPLRVWPGGLCLSRSIGDMDVGDYIVAVPHVKQIKVCMWVNILDMNY